jgi:hypothetical protein
MIAKHLTFARTQTHSPIFILPFGATMDTNAELVCNAVFCHYFSSFDQLWSFDTLAGAVRNKIGSKLLPDTVLRMPALSAETIQLFYNGAAMYVSFPMAVNSYLSVINKAFSSYNLHLHAYTTTPADPTHSEFIVVIKVLFFFNTVLLISTFDDNKTDIDFFWG